MARRRRATRTRRRARRAPRTPPAPARARAAPSGRRLADLTAADLLRPTLLAIHADTPLPEVARILAGQGIGGAPVVDAKRRLVGVISLHDLARAGGARRARGVHGSDGPPEAALARAKPKGRRRPASRTAADAMTRAIHSVPLHMPLPEVARVLVERRIHRVLVASRGRLAGILTSTDLLEALAGIRPGP